MKILVASQHFYPESFRINDIVQSLSGMGHDITVITGKPNYPEGKIYKGYKSFGVQNEKIWGCDIYRFPILPRGKGGAVNLIFNYVSYIFSGIILAPLYLRKKNFDVVFCYATSPILQVIPAIFLAHLRGAKLVVNVQDLWPESLIATKYVSNKLVLFFVKKIVQFIYGKSDLLLVQSECFRDRIIQLSSDAKIIYWPNSVPDFFSITSGDSVSNSEKSKFTVLFAGNLGVAQSLETIIGAASFLQEISSEVEILVAGHGSRADWLSNQIKERNLRNIKMLGRLPFNEMPDLMKKSSALLVTLANEEIFNLTIPNKVQAYMSVGKPIIGSIGGEGARIINESKSGIAISPENYLELANTILIMEKMDDEELSLYGINGKKYFEENFNHKKLVDKLVTYFSELSGKV